MLAYLMLFAAICSAICLYSVFFLLSFFFYWFLQMTFVSCFVLVYWHIVCSFQVWFFIMRCAFNLLVFPNSMFTPFFIWKGYMLSGEIALNNNHYYYYYPKFLPTSTHNLYNTCQSAYRPGHSAETALLKVVDDLFLSINKGNISVLAWLYLLDCTCCTVLYLLPCLTFFSIWHNWSSYPCTPSPYWLWIYWYCSSMVFILFDWSYTLRLYLIIVLLLLLHTQVFLSIPFLALCFSPCILSLCQPLLTHTIIHHSFADHV